MIWTLVGNASRARLFQRETAEGDWRLVEEFENPKSRARASDLVTGKAGRSQKRGSPSYSVALEPHTDPKRLEAEHFAATLAKHLEHGLGQGAYSRLYLVAPPRFLGLLRERLSEQVEKHLAGCLDKDFTSLEARELPAGLWALR
jgi:protein required for attachment to host cells